MEKILGFAAGNNIALRYILKRKNTLILLLNNDTVVEPDFLKYPVATLESNPLILEIIGSTTLSFISSNIKQSL